VDKGVDDLDLFIPTMRGFLTTLGLEGATSLYAGLLTIDLLLKAACAMRPYERERGRTDAVHRANLEDVRDGMQRGELFPAVRRCARRLADLHREAEPPRGRRARPLVGVAGDMYTRVNDSANRDLFHRLEALGCEVWPPPTLVDLAEYGVSVVLRQSLRRGDLPRLLESVAASLLMGRAGDRLRRTLGRFLEGRDEPELHHALSLAAPHVGCSNMELLQLNVAKLASFAERGADGLLNVVGQNCMVGTISAAVTSRIRRDHGGIPLTTLTYGPTESPAEHVSLEAFVGQVRRRFEERSRRA
jgi:hypothetical protein